MYADPSNKYILNKNLNVVQKTCMTVKKYQCPSEFTTSYVTTTNLEPKWADIFLTNTFQNLLKH